MTVIKVGLDVIGGDKAPQSTIRGAIRAKEEGASDIEVVLLGDQSMIEAELKRQNSPFDFPIVHAPECIEMGDHPVRALQAKPNSSIARGFALLKTGEIDAFASAGNSGAMLVGSTSIIGTPKNLLRPCIATLIPRQDGENNLLLDIGLNSDCKADHLYQFGIIGYHFLRVVMNVENPKVGLLNIGHEEGKGNILTQSTFKLMKDTKDFNFVGNVESRDMFTEKADVFVTDGFTGNMLLKQAEALYRVMLKRELMDDYFARFNYEDYGGTPVLGTNRPVMLGHGISNDTAIMNMIRNAAKVSRSNFNTIIKEALDNE